MGNLTESGLGGGTLCSPRRLDSQPRTSGAGGAANEARGGKARSRSLGPAAARRAIWGFYFFGGEFRKKNFFFNLNQ